MASSRLCVVTWLALAAPSALACRLGGPPGAGEEAAPAPGAASAPAPAPSRAGNESSSLFDLEPASPAEDAEPASCAGQVSRAEPVDVDLFIMLDISGSMLESTPAGTDKWTAIQAALESFLTAPSSEGLSVGIQYFPLDGEGGFNRCQSDDDCGGSLCLYDTCAGALGLGVDLPCQSDAECGPSALGGLGSLFPLGPCLPRGACSVAPALACADPGTPCALDSGARGTCLPAPNGVCSEAALCDARSYAAPAVEIAPLPEAAPALLASIESQRPQGGTPSGPALRGAVELARDWARSHPGHAVATVLATDGSPTDCEPLDAAGLAELAAAGYDGAPSVRTFTIGVFGDADQDAPAALDRIARAGGTDSAFIIDSNRDIAAQLLDALDTIRGVRLACEFALPEPGPHGALDLDRVNVDVTNATGKTRLRRTSGAPACDDVGGWYYDDPLDPSRLVLCPASCGVLERAPEETSVEIQVGCRSVLR